MVHEPALDREVMLQVASGRTINISRGGLLARMDQSVTTGSRCLVHFDKGSDRVRPSRAWGKVLRTQGWGEHFVVAIEFETPLQVLELTTSDEEPTR